MVRAAARSVVVFVCALAAFSTACSADYLMPNIFIRADQSGQTAPVELRRDEEINVNVALNAFLPPAFQVHAGDTVEFRLESTGTPHTLAFGRFVDEAVEQIPREFETIAELEALPEFRRLPMPFVRPEGRPRANQAAAAPCYIDAAASVSIAACQDERLPFDGTQVFYSTGLLDPDETIAIELSERIEPGTYSFMCMVHRANMTGTMEVVPQDVDIEPMRVVRRDGDREVERLVTAIEDADFELPPSGTVLLGMRGNAQQSFVADFLPREVRIRPGEAITWRITGLHSVSFKPPGGVREIWRREDGAVTLDEQAWLPTEGITLPPEVAVWPPPAAAVAIDGGSWDGEDFVSSGIIRAEPPLDVTYALTFTTPGRYEMRCLVHQIAQGQVIVEEG